jgi:2-phospho-L-lactate guanylyltransferase
MGESGSGGLDMFWALVPVKQTAQSKQRLATVLDRGEREALVLAMLQDVLLAIRDVSVFDGVLLVTRSKKVQVLARDLVSEVFEESPGSDHSRAVTEANAYLIERHRASSSLAISGDIPRVTAKDIRQIIKHRNGVSLMPNESGEGTNAILCSPPNLITSQFGGPSLKRHVASATAAGLSPSIIQNENIAMDIDEPRDLERALADLAPSFTRTYLQDSGIAERLRNHNVSETTRVLEDSIAADQWTSTTI